MSAPAAAARKALGKSTKRSMYPSHLPISVSGGFSLPAPAAERSTAHDANLTQFAIERSGPDRMLVEPSNS